MENDSIKDGNSWSFPVTDNFSIQVNNNERLAGQLLKILGQTQECGRGQPVCVIDAGQQEKQHFKIDFDYFAPGCTLNCNSDTSAVKLLPWINILLPSAQSISMHASAFSWNGEGVVVTGDAGSGKTGVLLAAIHQGAKAIGDECLWLDHKAALRGLFVEMEIRADYFRELPYLQNEVSSITLYSVYLCDLIGRWIKPFFPNLSRKFAGRARAHLEPDIVKRHLAEDARLDRLFVSEVHEGSDIQVLPADLSEIIPRLVKIQCTEFARQQEQYLRFRDESATRHNEWMGNLAERLEKLFSDILQSCRCYIVKRPPRCRAEDLFGALKKSWD